MDRQYVIQLWRKGWKWETVTKPASYDETRNAIAGNVPLGAGYQIKEVTQ